MKYGTLFRTKWFEIWWNSTTPFALYVNAGDILNNTPN